MIISIFKVQYFICSFGLIKIDQIYQGVKKVDLHYEPHVFQYKHTPGKDTVDADDAFQQADKTDASKGIEVKNADSSNQAGIVNEAAAKEIDINDKVEADTIQHSDTKVMIDPDDQDFLKVNDESKEEKPPVPVEEEPFKQEIAIEVTKNNSIELIEQSISGNYEGENKILSQIEMEIAVDQSNDDFQTVGEIKDDTEIKEDDKFQNKELAFDEKVVNDSAKEENLDSNVQRIGEEMSDQEDKVETLEFQGDVNSNAREESPIQQQNIKMEKKDDIIGYDIETFHPEEKRQESQEDATVIKSAPIRADEDTLKSTASAEPGVENTKEPKETEKKKKEKKKSFIKEWQEDLKEFFGGRKKKSSKAEKQRGNDDESVPLTKQNDDRYKCRCRFQSFT